jgi:hypothetical protein
MEVQLKLVCLLLLFMCSHLAHADSFLYSVVYDDGFASLSTSFIEPAILTQNTQLENSDLLTASWTYNGVSGDGFIYLFLSPGFNPSQPTSEPLITILLPVGQYVTMAFYDDLNSVGTYQQAFFDDGHLTISDESSPVPEPATSTSVGLGTLAMILLLRSRLRRTTSPSLEDVIHQSSS